MGAFRFLFEKICLKDRELPRDCFWLGHKVHAVDGTKLTLPNSKEIIEQFPQRITSCAKTSTKVCHYPFGRLVTVCNVLTGQPIAAQVTNMHGSERVSAISLLDHLSKGDICLLDRGLDGKRVWLGCEEKGIFFVSRLRTISGKGGFFGQIEAFLESKRRETIIEVKTVDHRKEENRETAIKMRLIRGRQVKDGSILVIGTNLIDRKKYPFSKVLKLYGRRWAEETMYFHLKILLKLEDFHSRKVNGILQEVYAHLFILSLIIALALKAASRQKMALSDQMPNLKNTLNVLARHLFYFISPLEIGVFRIKEITEQIIFQIVSIKCKKQKGRSYPRYSRKPINHWTMAKASKIRAHQLGRRPGAGKGMLEKYRNMDELKKCA